MLAHGCWTALSLLRCPQILLMRGDQKLEEIKGADMALLEKHLNKYSIP